MYLYNYNSVLQYLDKLRERICKNKQKSFEPSSSDFSIRITLLDR